MFASFRNRCSEVTGISVRKLPELLLGSYRNPHPTVGPGYVWHCHILDHEDNEMMRPYLVTP
ncbi:MAG: multicopper oxidase domain-containing protein [Bacillota bacterium]|nr:multicopper oxidase domain-containing protein [Bacillota bacterium]